MQTEDVYKTENQFNSFSGVVLVLFHLFISFKSNKADQGLHPPAATDVKTFTSVLTLSFLANSIHRFRGSHERWAGGFLPVCLCVIW